MASDLGSSGCKTVVVDGRGTILGTAAREYPTHYRRPGWAEQEPEDWVAAAIASTGDAVARSGVDPGDVAGYGVVGVTHNAVLMGPGSSPLRCSITLFDTRSGDECRSIGGRFGDRVFARSRNGVSTAWTWPQLAWVREHEPDTWRRVERVLFQKDYVRNRLAPSEVTDTIDAAGSLLFDPVSGEWIGEFVADLGLPDGVLPRAVGPTDVVSALSPAAAARMGLKAGTPVVAGTTDTAAEVLGAGAVRPGQATVKLASVGRITVVSNAPCVDPRALNYRHVLDPLWYPGAATKYAASAYRWLRDLAAPGVSFADLTAEAGKSPPGAGGLLFHPHLNGEWAPYWDDGLRGAFVGLTAAHGRGDLARAVMEGVALAIAEAFEFMQGAGLASDELRLLGGGSSARLWSQIVADVLGRPLIVPANRDAAFGAALVVGMGVGLFPRRVEEISKVIATGALIAPDPDRVALYRDLAAVYRASEAALTPVHRALGQFAAASAS